MRASTVAPFTGAWIEMDGHWQLCRVGESLPSRERGLKYGHHAAGERRYRSLPSRERGLKYDESG